LNNGVVAWGFIVPPATEKEARRRTISLKKRGYWSTDHEKQL
jgi:hypothetical protein